jgi:hypothetical protein
MAEQHGKSAAAAAAAQVQAVLEAEAERIRADADRVGKRADEVERRLEELATGVREALAELKREVAQLRESAEEPTTPSDLETIDAEVLAASEPADDELIAEAEAVAARRPDAKDPGEDAPAPPEDATAAPEDAPAAPEGARLLALKMALDGRPRAETAGYLRENFELDDPEALLDEVYARAEARK